MPAKGSYTGKYVQCEICGKEIYKTQTQFKRSMHHYCSRECNLIGLHETKFEERNCEVCGQTYSVSKKSTQRFCSTYCQKIWQTSRTGNLNPKYTRLPTVCGICGKTFDLKKYLSEDGKQHFCSVECKRQWYATVWSQQEQWKEQSRDRAINMLTDQRINTQTKPQICVNRMLNDLNIEYKNEVPFNYYSVDNYLSDENLIIEVMGDYWHGHPMKFSELSKIQKDNVRRDKDKNTYIRLYHSINILYLWESDINNRPELCKQLILEYIENSGIISDYHSFNYCLENNKLILNQTIIDY